MRTYKHMLEVKRFMRCPERWPGVILCITVLVLPSYGSDQDIPLLHVDDFDLMDQMVSQKKADFTVFDALRAFVATYENKNLTISVFYSRLYW
jgi:hypothetical protein